MRKTRGFRLGRKLIRVFKWVIKPKAKPTGYHCLSSPDYKTTTMTKICNWGRCLKRGAKELCFSKSALGYSPVGQDPFEPKSVEVPKGHLVVYVGQKDDDPHRFLVPVIYFNHPLFGELLREAEKEYGFEHSGGITLPCPLSEFENVQTRIAAGRKTTLKRRMR